MEVNMKLTIKIDQEQLQQAIDNAVADIKKNCDFMVVTRCKNCVYNYDGECHNQKNRIAYHCPDFGEHYSYKSGITVEPDHFCGYGEEKE